MRDSSVEAIVRGGGTMSRRHPTASNAGGIHLHIPTWELETSLTMPKPKHMVRYWPSISIIGSSISWLKIYVWIRKKNLKTKKWAWNNKKERSNERILTNSVNDLIDDELRPFPPPLFVRCFEGELLGAFCIAWLWLLSSDVFLRSFRNRILKKKLKKSASGP
jgi:hypothetical protein